jgi:hypothetical protein
MSETMNANCIAFCYGEGSRSRRYNEYDNRRGEDHHDANHRAPEY